MHATLRTGAMALTLLGALGAFATGAMADTYKVTVYNLTKGQVFSPPVVAAHSRSVSVFTPGVAATPGLAGVAEDADNPLLIAELEGAGATVETGSGIILPGHHDTVTIKTGNGNRRISVVGMLVTTNDGFYGLNGVRTRGKSNSYYVPAYDAGSEVNDENCDFIPGPPCEKHVAGPREDGVVHIHNGIHGIGGNGVTPEEHDWRNPVAKIKITRVKRDRDDDDEDDDDD